MGIEVRPLGVRCNIQCLYCYQNPIRNAESSRHSYDLVQIKEALTQDDQDFTIFGGEPLLLPLKDLETLWAWGYDKFGKNSLQTNGTLISDEHIEAFKKYNVHVGISIDGPGELNDIRWHGTLERTRQSTAKTISAIERLCKIGRPPGLIITLHRGNATASRLPILLEWVKSLSTSKISNIRLHLLESESASIRESLSLTDQENISALLAFRRLSSELPSLRFDLFQDMQRLLIGDDRQVGCVWTACDPYTTVAVAGINGHGQRGNCSRTMKDGVEFTKARRAGFERYISLYRTNQANGGCQGCRFFLMCKGQCPGTAIDGDWRNRTEHCEVWKSVFEVLESELVSRDVQPVSLHPQRSRIEALMVEGWTGGKNNSLFGLIAGLNR
jgi:uncharacterized protein